MSSQWSPATTPTQLHCGHYPDMAHRLHPFRTARCEMQSAAKVINAFQHGCNVVEKPPSVHRISRRSPCCDEGTLCLFPLCPRSTSLIGLIVISHSLPPRHTDVSQQHAAAAILCSFEERIFTVSNLIWCTYMPLHDSFVFTGMLRIRHLYNRELPLAATSHHEPT